METRFPSLKTPTMFKLSLLILALIDAEAGASSPSTSAHIHLKSCRQPPYKQWMDSNQYKTIGSSSCKNSIFRTALETRGGGGIWGRSNPEKEEEQSASDEEYEYYEVDEEVSEGDEDAEYEFYAEDTEVGDSGEYEYYEEEEKPAADNFGKVQDLNGEFIDSSDEDEETMTETVTLDSEENTDDDDDDSTVGIDEKDVKQGGRSFWGRGKRAVTKEVDVAANEDNTDPNPGYQTIQDEDEAKDAEEYYDEDEEYLFTTPIPKAKSPRKLQLANRTVPKTEMEDADDIEEYEEDEYLEEGEDDYLYENPIENTSPSNNKRKAPKASKTDNNSRWWQKMREKGQSSKGRSSWRPTSSSKASFVSPLFYSGAGAPRSFSLRSSNGRPIYSEWMSSISAAVNAIVQPIGNGIQTITFGVSRWISMSWSVVRNSFDFLWNGPVDGVTTTGITTRDGGLSAILMSSPVAIAISSIVILGVMTVMVRKLWHETSGNDLGIRNILRRKKRLRKSPDTFDDEEDYDEDAADEPPSIEAELEFLNREFEAVNPSSKDRITKAITKENRFSWPLRNDNDDKPKSRRGQRQFTIKSIQNWWRERPSQRAIAIIEPEHLRKKHQPQPLGQEVKRLQKQLAVSEQERAILQQDVQRLQHKVQKAHHDARSIISQNKWLEKQTSKADQILTKAVEIERRKANEEMGRVRESMKGVLERERMLMRGRDAGSERRAIGGQNDLDLNKGPPTRRLDGVNIVREMDRVNENDDVNKPWATL